MTSFSVSCADDLTKTTGFIEILCVQTSYKYCKYTTQKCKGENLQFGNFATPSEFAISLSQDMGLHEVLRGDKLLHFYIDIDTELLYNGTLAPLMVYIQNIQKIDVLFSRFHLEFRLKSINKESGKEEDVKLSDDEQYISAHIIFDDVIGTHTDFEKFVEKYNILCDRGVYKDGKRLMRRFGQTKASFPNSKMQNMVIDKVTPIIAIQCVDVNDKNTISQFITSSVKELNTFYEQNLGVKVQAPETGMLECDDEQCQPQTPVIADGLEAQKKHYISLVCMLRHPKMHEAMFQESGAYEARLKVLCSIAHTFKENSDKVLKLLVDNGLFSSRAIGTEQSTIYDKMHSFAKDRSHDKILHVGGLTRTCEELKDYIAPKIEKPKQQKEDNSFIIEDVEGFKEKYTFDIRSNITLEDITEKKYGDNKEAFLQDMAKVVWVMLDNAFVVKRNLMYPGEKQVEYLKVSSVCSMIMAQKKMQKVFMDNLQLFIHKDTLEMFNEQGNTSQQIFTGFKYQPVQNDDLTKQYWQLVREKICCNSESKYTFMRQYMAHLIQKPNIRTNILPIISAEHGLGKNLVFEAVGEIFGQFALMTSKIDGVFGRFNTDVLGKLFIILNEVESQDQHQNMLNQIKNCVTGETIQVEQKGQNIVMYKNYVNYIILSNRESPLYEERSERRMIKFICASKYPLTFYNELINTMKCQTFAGLKYRPEFINALLYDLLHETLPENIYFQGEIANIQDEENKYTPGENCQSLENQYLKLKGIEKFIVDNWQACCEGVLVNELVDEAGVKFTSGVILGKFEIDRVQGIKRPQRLVNIGVGDRIRIYKLNTKRCDIQKLAIIAEYNKSYDVVK